jgi:FkbM family methyltransferase
MLEIKKYEFQKPIEENGWIKDWHGNHRLMECLNQDFNNMLSKRESEIESHWHIPERIFERYVMASIIESFTQPRVNFVEIGAGYGEWCMAFDGLINHTSLKGLFIDCNCIGIEPDLIHFGWLQKHLEVNGIKGKAYQAVVSDKIGSVCITKSTNPDYDYGQRIVSSGFDLKTIYGLFKWIKGDIERVESYTMDSMFLKFPNPHVNLVHIDVQGAEDKVLQGAQGMIKNGLIDYFMIGTHSDSKHDKVKSMLDGRYVFVADIRPNSVGETVIGDVEVQDGILVCERIGI